jgi:hypothetical protein
VKEKISCLNKSLLLFSYSFLQKPRKTGDDEESEDLDLEDEEILDEGEEEEEEGSGTGNTYTVKKGPQPGCL